MSDQAQALASAGVQDSLARLDVDAFAVVSLKGLAGSKLEQDALRLLPETRSVVVFAMEVYREILGLAKPGRTMGAAPLSDLLDRHNDFINGRLTKAAYDVARASHKIGLKALPLPAAGCPLDTRFLDSIFSYKHAGQAAGLGYIGRSSLLITPDYGPRVRLSCCLTEAVLVADAKAGEDACDGCDVCIRGCPAGALSAPQSDGPYAINKFACSAFRNASGGCSECARLCPAGR